jgi:hypothetical protein
MKGTFWRKKKEGNDARLSISIRYRGRAIN